ncbi:hypothetical protein BDZ94DRAFT_1161878 [Collybia nuda]|uniref:Uncharacterized protein n=1 Tax=Collybia nuda TaxID=64659 RepID=A0A9P6CL67_9AGAR|nr:hypothetical protein BDZ94DRAFT_1161878 [Collybia nuda]
MREVQSDDPTSPGSPPITSQSPRRRPRAGTTNSRIYNHCIQSSQRFSRATPADHDNQLSTSQTASPLLVHNDGMVTLEGSQADIRINSSGVGSFSDTHLDTTPIYMVDLSGTHHDDIVEHLDVIDPHVATLSSLTNAANTILIPPLSWYSRKPIFVLTSPPTANVGSEIGYRRDDPEQFKDSLDRHVDDVLRRRSKFRRTMKGVWSFLKTPMGIITAIYGFLVVFWGAAIVIFLAKIINFHNEDTQGFWVEVSSQIENGLFTVTGIGLIPSRILDTYRVCIIWHYKRKTRKLRTEAGLPQLFDVDDLPDPAYDPNYVHVLTEKQENYLHRQQRKFQHHQTWYRPHGTETHRAFPINTALLICLLSDGNSIFQACLLNRFNRPAWTTGTLIPASFLCGIFAAVFIWRGGQQTKRVGEVEKRLREILDAETPPEVDGNDLAGICRHVSNRLPEPDIEEKVINDTTIVGRMVIPTAGQDGNIIT